MTRVKGNLHLVVFAPPDALCPRGSVRAARAVSPADTGTFFRKPYKQS